MQQMRAFILPNAGSTENLQMVNIEIPAIKENEVLVKVSSISINQVDVKARADERVLQWIYGNDRPVILGWDISGIIVKTGKEVDDFSSGDEVFGMVNFFGVGKAYAEYVVCSPDHLALKPTNISHEEAAAACLAAVTAQQALVDIANIKPGQKVLIHGSSGGVGHFAVQIAKWLGAFVVGSSSGRNRDFVLSLGADKHIDYIETKFTDEVSEMDIVLDTLQGHTLHESLTVVKENGIIVTLPSPDIPEEIRHEAARQGKKVAFMMVASKKDSINAVAKLLENGALKAHIHEIYAFEDIAMAHRDVESNHVVGKVVVNTIGV